MAPKTIGRYELGRLLGRGGMAVVHLAHDPRIDRDVALKLLPREFLHDPMFRTRFEREAKTIASLEHEAIVPLYDFGEDDGQPYLVMRYMAGGSLADRIERGRLSVEEAARVLSRLAPALDRAHARGIIHRDLKPGNILQDGDGNPFLSDFGIVKLGEATAALTGSGIIGTPAYMSPEQIEARGEIDGRSDVYALGVILFEMLTGELPYRADTPMGLALMHINEPTPRILEVRDDLPTGIEEVIQKALAKDRTQRYPTAAALAEDLRAVAEGTYVPAPPQSQTLVAPEGPAPEPLGSSELETAAPELGEATAVAPPEDVAQKPIAEPPAAEPSKEAEPVPPTVAPEDAAVRASSESKPARQRVRIPIWAWIGLAVVGIGGGLAATGVLSGLFAATPAATATPEPRPSSTATSRPSPTQAPTEPPTPQPSPTAGFSPADLTRLYNLGAEQGTYMMKVLDWSPDGSHVVSAGKPTASGFDHDLLYLWDAGADFQLLATAQTEARDIEDLAWSPDGTRLASVGTDGRLKVWDSESLALIADVVVSTGFVRSVAWSPEADRIATGSVGGEIKVWDAASGERQTTLCCHSFNTGNAGSLAWSPDGTQVLSAGSDSQLILWDVASGEIVRRFCCHTTPWVRTLAWSPDRSLIASGGQAGGGGGSLYLWDPNTGQQIRQLGGVDEAVLALDWSPDGNMLAVAYTLDQLRIWDTEAGSLLAEYQLLADGGWAQLYSDDLEWSPDGRYIGIGVTAYQADFRSEPAGRLLILGMP